MGCFEIFLLLSSISSFIAGVNLYYENYKLIGYTTDILQTNIDLTHELILAYQEIEKLKKCTKQIN